MSLVLDVDDAVPSLAAADGFAVDDDIRLGADDSEGDHLLQTWKLVSMRALIRGKAETNPDPGVEGALLFVVILRVEGVEPDRVVLEFGTNLRKMMGWNQSRP